MKKSKEQLPFITFRDVTLQLRDCRILEQLNWAIADNEHWAIVGGNGAGKSVLARALYGGVPVVGGEILYHFLARMKLQSNEGDHLTPEDFIAHVSFEDHRHLIGTESSYYQSRWNSPGNDSIVRVSDVLPEMADNVGNACRAHNSSEYARDPVTHKTGILTQLGIAHLLHEKIVHLSNGEIRKVLIAQALLESPLLLILDEPFVGLDYGTRRALRKIVNHLMTGPMRVIFATSRTDEIPAGITHVLWLDRGEIVGAGEKKKLLRRPPVRGRRITPVKKGAFQPRQRRRAKPRVLIEINNASVTYGHARILDDISWVVEEGQNWAVLGPNGSGKTTLLSLILGDNPQAYSNDVRLFGRSRGSGESIWDIKKICGYLSPEIQIHYRKQMTGYEVICSGFFDSIGLYERCSERQEREASAWIRKLRLHNAAEKRFDELSSGEQRMVLMARAAIKRPKLLVLDEPCQGLDLENRALVLATMNEIGRRGIGSLIYVTHRLNEIPDCISHVIRLRKGRTVRKGERTRGLGR
jgi:molybdate transport system ATP-binding protein